MSRRLVEPLLKFRLSNLKSLDLRNSVERKVDFIFEGRIGVKSCVKCILGRCPDYL